MSIRWLAFLLSANLAVSVAQEDIELTKEELAATLVGLEVSEISESPVSGVYEVCLLYTSPSPRDGLLSRMPSSA